MFLTAAGAQVVLVLVGMVFLGLCVDLVRDLVKGER